MQELHSQVIFNLWFFQKYLLSFSQVVYAETRSLERSQAAAYNGAPQYSTLEQLEQWYQSLATIIWKSLRQLVHLEGKFDTLDKFKDFLQGSQFRSEMVKIRFQT